jgi:hypothetical protein
MIPLGEGLKPLSSNLKQDLFRSLTQERKWVSEADTFRKVDHASLFGQAKSLANDRHMK